MQALIENGAEMPDALVGTLWNIIQRLKVSLIIALTYLLHIFVVLGARVQHAELVLCVLAAQTIGKRQACCSRESRKIQCTGST